MLTGSFQLLSFAAIGLFCSAVKVQASPVVWTLSDVRLSDGSSITGTFTLDVDLPIPPTGLTQYSIQVSGGSRMPDFLYTPSNPFSQLLLFSFVGPSGQRVERLNAFRGNVPNGTALELLYLDPVTFLSNAGGTVPLDLPTSSGQISNGEISIFTAPAVSGSFIGTPAHIPEPSSFVLFLCGMAVVTGLRRRQRAKVMPRM